MKYLTVFPPTEHWLELNFRDELAKYTAPDHRENVLKDAQRVIYFLYAGLPSPTVEKIMEILGVDYDKTFVEVGSQLAAQYERGEL